MSIIQQRANYFDTFRRNGNSNSLQLMFNVVYVLCLNHVCGLAAIGSRTSAFHDDDTCYVFIQEFEECGSISLLKLITCYDCKSIRLCSGAHNP